MLCCIMHEYLYIYICTCVTSLAGCERIGQRSADTQMMFANGSLAAGRFDVTLQERSSKEERNEQCGSMQLKCSHILYMHILA